ncbi:MAG: DUF1343 domain-containing protein [Leptospiraceae bacterium]|nr:DUF1343 domain-containing protein [Leptospiraceae bacterium]MCK6380273.1 DUF1343 domain-containing protein [Leptospiraceae bacterium]NUM42447.1 DUF1343 domain-containing protein [Leptospiraceae bacterium]
MKKISSKSKKLLSGLSTARTGILTNQSAFGWDKTYHFQKLKDYLELRVIFLPEHGLFAELQDQVSGDSLKYFFDSITIENLYGKDENSLFIREETLKNLDLIVIDIRDIGSRYYTFLTSAYYILQKISNYNKTSSNKIQILVVDSPNPIGRKIEGSPLQEKYESFVGVKKIVHRHGLSTAELMNYHNIENNFNLNIFVIPIGEIYPQKDSEDFWIPPSPNIPKISTCTVYTGQCLLEGTNLSEGRGTTRPFEIFGAPFIDINNQSYWNELIRYQKDFFYLRPLLFIPTFHKHRDKVCGGFQIFVQNKNKFHSLLFSLQFLKVTNDFFKENFQYLQGVYEFRSDKSAIELLVGDDFLLGFLNGVNTYKMTEDYLKNEEFEWKKKIKIFKT